MRPVGTANTVTTNEDTAYVFTTIDFGFSDPGDTPANALLAVKVTTLPGAGALTLNGVAVTTGQFIGIADINAGNLVFAPAANANGTGYASFTFQVQDNGGGTDAGSLDRAGHMTINVNAVNDAPVGTANTVTTNEDTAYVFTTVDFGFSDPGDTPANALLAVKDHYPARRRHVDPQRRGRDRRPVHRRSPTSMPAIWCSRRRPTPTARAMPSFTFQVQDNGGTSNGGVDLDPTARTLTINVTAVNDAPVGTANTVTTNEDTAYVFTTIDFGFSDPGDAPANALLAVKVTTLPGAGTLTLNGVAVTAGQFIGIADINAGKLVFTPAANANGAGYATFTFQVQDNGGTGTAASIWIPLPGR